jgi:hypothetical protein
MARSKWEHKCQQRLDLRAEMSPQYRIVSDWLYGLMERRKLTNFSEVYQFFFKCAVECLPRELLGDAKVPTVSILGSWFRGESGVNNKWLDSIAYVRRCEEGLPEDFSGADVMLWIRTAPDLDVEPPEPVVELEVVAEKSIVPTEDQIATWTEEETALVVSLAVAHWRSVSALNAAASKKGKK